MENEYDRLDKHILVRFSDKHNLFAHNGAIKEHNEILKKNGHVWFGKLGRKLSNKNISDLNLQIQKKILTVLFLVRTYNKLSTVHMAYLSKVSSVITRKELECVPAYYQNHYKSVSIWFQFSRLTKLQTSVLSQILIHSSGKPASETILESMSSLFVVEMDRGSSVQSLKEIE